MKTLAIVISAIAAFTCISPGFAQAQALPAEQHPSLLFTADDVSVLKERIQREPYATWWQTVLERAD